MSTTGHFDRLAARYDEFRSPMGVTALHERLVREGNLAGRRVLDIGCGTGVTLAVLAERFHCAAAGVDPSERMLEVARARLPGADLRLAAAEELPFADASFDAALMQLVVHHVDRRRAFPEARRVLVPGGRFLIATTDPAGFPRIWMAPLFPSYVNVSRRVFPELPALEDELRAAGFTAIRRIPFVVERRFSREEALAKLRGRAYSTFEHMPEEEIEAGIRRAERQLPQTVEYTLESAIFVAER